MSDDASRLWSRPQAPELERSTYVIEDPPPPPPGDRAADDGAPPLKHWWAGLAAFALSIVVAGVGLGVIAAATGDEGELGPGTTIASTYLQDAAFFLSAFLFAHLSHRAAPRVALGLRRPVRPGQALKVAVAAWVVFFVVSGIYGAVLGIQDASEETVDSLGLRQSTVNLVFAGVLVAVIAPIVEETLFRGLLFGALWKRFGWIAGAVGSGLAFGVIHAGGAVWEALPVLAVLGFALAWLYRRTGSLVPGIAVHALNNGIALAATVSWAPGWSVLLVVGTTTATTLIAWLISAPARSVTPAA